MRRKSLKTDIATLDELAPCITALRNEFANLETEIEVHEYTDKLFFVEIWKL